MLIKMKGILPIYYGGQKFEILEYNSDNCQVKLESNEIKTFRTNMIGTQIYNSESKKFIEGINTLNQKIFHVKYKNNWWISEVIRRYCSLMEFTIKYFKTIKTYPNFSTMEDIIVCLRNIERGISEGKISKSHDIYDSINKVLTSKWYNKKIIVEC